MTLAMGDRLGRYEITGILGRGAMGVVYLAHDPHIERPVALKTLAPEPGAPDRGADVEARFIKEAKIAGRLQHPNIVTIYDVGRDKDVAFIAMEFVDGEPLTNWVGRESFTLPQRVDVVRQAARALEHAHERGVIHRDVKPGNILLTAGRLVKVADFGIGKLLISGTPDLTQTGTLVGSPAYMSPEQIKGERLDGRSDFFSLGVVFYQLLTGQRPFPGEAITTLVYQILHTEPRDPREWKRDLPASSREVFARLLAKSPADRPGNAAQFIGEIEKFETDRTVRLSDLRKLAESGGPPLASTRPAQSTPPPIIAPRPTPTARPPMPEPPAPAPPRPPTRPPEPEPSSPPLPWSPMPPERPPTPPERPIVPQPPKPIAPWPPTPVASSSTRETIPSVSPAPSPPLRPTVRLGIPDTADFTPPARRSSLPLILAVIAIAVIAGIVVLFRPGSSRRGRAESTVARAAAPAATSVPTSAGPAATPTSSAISGGPLSAQPKPTSPPPAATALPTRAVAARAPSPTASRSPRSITPAAPAVSAEPRRSPTAPRAARATPIAIAAALPTPTTPALEAPRPPAPAPTSAAVTEQPASSAPAAPARPAAAEGGGNADRLNAMIEQGRVLFKTARYKDCVAVLGDLQEECKKKENEYICLGLRAGASFYRGAAFAELGDEISARAQFWIFLAMKPNTVLSPREYSYKVIHAFDLARRMR